MNGYPGYFLAHWGQLTSLATVAAVWLGFAALGAVVAGRGRTAEATPIYGWAVASAAFTVLGVFTPLSFAWLAAALAALSMVALVVAIRRGDAVFAAGSGRILVLALPLILLVSAMAGSQWDEFGTWLMIPRRLLVLDGFPDRATKLMGSTYEAYPYGWHVVTYLASRLAGRLVENAGALVNVLLLLSFGLTVARMIDDGRDGDRRATPGWGVCALGGLAATLAAATQKIALTAYADTATAVAVGFGAVLGWRMLDALARDEGRSAKRLAFEVGLVMLVLVNLKQATVVLFALVVGAVVVAGLRDPAVRARDLLRLLPAMTLPAVAVYAIWRYYVANELAGAEFAVRPIDGWLIRLIPEIVWKMLVVLSKKGLYLAVMAAAVVFAARALVCVRAPIDRLAIVVGALFLGYNGFLLFAYVTAFGELDALRVGSLWRYNMHLVPAAVAFAAYGLAMLWARHVEPHLGGRRLAWLPIILIVAAPLAFAPRLRFDRDQPVPFFRDVGRAVAALVTSDDRMFVVDPKGSGESAVITRFELSDPAIVRGYMSSFHPPTRNFLDTVFDASNYTVILLHSTTPEVQRAAGAPLTDGVSTLLRRNADGKWAAVANWKRP